MNELLKIENLSKKYQEKLIFNNFNFLINPTHPLFSEMKVIAITNISFDQRLVKPVS